MENRFWSKVSKKSPDECWEWQAARFTSGYGMFAIHSHPYKAHRVAYSLFYGEIPKGLEICHSCDNKACVNPKHLRANTHQANMREAVERGLLRHDAIEWLRGEESPHAKLTAAQVLGIRKMYSGGEASQRELAAMFHVGRSTIRHIIYRNTWKHI